MSPSHYEARLEADLERIRERVAKVAERIEEGLQNSLQALLALDKKLAYQTVLGDFPINRSIMEIDRLCHYFVARHLPSAGHLRFISSVLRMSVELERIGDYAVTISRETVQLSRPLDKLVAGEAERLAKDTFQMFEQALRAFKEQNAELAKATMSYGHQIDRSFAAVFDELVEAGQEHKGPVRDLFGTLVIFNRLERVSDQATNLCEETIFAVTGETKQAKAYRVMFLDQGNDCRSQIAAAIAKKAYPESGIYTSAGLHPVDKLDPVCTTFMDERGIDLRGESPRSIHEVHGWSDFRVIVSLQGPIHDYVSDVPFRTVALEWDIPEPPGKEATEAEARARLEEIYKQMALEIRILMETLRGEEAS